MPNMGSASLAVTAREKGYFEEMGLTVELVEFQGGPAEIAAMAAGDIAISQIGHGAHALCAEGEAVIFQIDCTSLADAVIGNADKGISSIADLKGKKVAATSGTSAEIILNLALKSAGLTSDDLEIVEMDANGMVSAMVSGNVDACATWSPGTVTISEALGDKTVWLATNQDYINEATFPSSFITTQKYADEHHDVLVRFSRALQKASRGRVLKNALGFVLGFTLLFVAMGAFAGSIGALLTRHQQAVNIVSGLIVIFFGLNFLGVFRLSLFRGSKGYSVGHDMGFFSALVFGAVFAVGWTPCVGAFLGSALVLASQQGSTLQGILLLLCYSAGLGIPFLASALLIQSLKTAFDWIKRHYSIINAVSGGLLIVVGILMATGTMGTLLSRLV